MASRINTILMTTTMGIAFATVWLYGFVSVPGIQERNTKLTQYYENISTRTLSRYYEEATFLVKAKVESELILESPVPEDDFSDPEIETPQQLPGLPFLPEKDKLSPRTENQQSGKTGELGQSPKEKQNQRESNYIVTLDVLVDTSYSDRDIDFLQNLLAMSIHLDDQRGDRINIHEGVFPRDNRAFQDYHKPLEAPPISIQPTATKPDSAAVGLASDSRNGSGMRPAESTALANPFSSYMDHLPSLIPLLLICLLILACVWMVTRAISGSAALNQKEKVLTSMSIPDQAKLVMEPALPLLTKPQPSELNSFRPFLLNCFVGSPKQCGQIIKSWLQRDKEKGLCDSAVLVASLDPRLLGILGPELGRELTHSLEIRVNAEEVKAPEEVVKIYKEFKREFQNLTQGTSQEEHYRDLFGFLRQMNEQQIMHILRDESQGIAGLVMAQLSGEMSGAILQRMDPEMRAKLLIAMGNIDHIPLNVYREIADRLSLKALDVGDMRFVAADGVESILELIDKLPLNLQFNYIHSISEMDLGLGEKIRNRYVTLPEMAGLPDKFLRNILQNLDQETLILALVHLEEAIRNKILFLLPERMQMLVTGGIEGARDKMPKDSEMAQRRILHRIRDEIRHSGRPA